MKEIINNNIQQVIAIGDVHGSFNDLIFKLKRLEISNTLLIQLGDFGVGFNKETEDILTLIQLDSLLKDSDNFLIIVRGNHDNPAFFSNPNLQFENIILVKDYELFNFKSKQLNKNLKFLCVGGGISIDRSRRKLGIGYWPDEVVKNIPPNIYNMNEAIDYLFMHTGPDFLKLNCFNINNDIKLETDLLNERVIINNLIDRINFKTFYCGHFHINNEVNIHNKRYVTINILEFKQII